MCLHSAGCGLGVALFLAAPMACVAGPGLAPPGTLKQEIAAARRAGLPLTPGELARRPPVRAADNAAPLYRKLDALLMARPITQEEADIVEGRALKPDASVADIAAAAAFFARRKDLMDLIHRAAARPDCDFQRDWSLGPSLLFPEFSRLRKAGRLLSCEANVQACRGDVAGAMRTCAAIGKVARHASSDPYLIAHLVDYAIESLGMSRIEAVLRAHPTEAMARAASAAIACYRTRPVGEAIRGEAVMAMVCVEMLRKDPASLADLTGDTGSRANGAPARPRLSPAMVDANAAYLVWYFHMMAGALRQPYPVGRRTVSAVQAEVDARTARRDMTTLLGAFLLPVFTQAGDQAARAAAQQGALRAMAAALEFRARHTALPSTLASCMKAVPTDPFDGKPMRYRVEGKSFVIYSVGPTGKYAGAPKQPGQPFREVVLRWPGA